MDHNLFFSLYLLEGGGGADNMIRRYFSNFIQMVQTSSIIDATRIQTKKTQAMKSRKWHSKEINNVLCETSTSFLDEYVKHQILSMKHIHLHICSCKSTKETVPNHMIKQKCILQIILRGSWHNSNYLKESF